AAADRPRTAPTGSGTTARTGSAPGRARTTGSCLGFFGRAQGLERTPDFASGATLAQRHVRVRPREAVALERGHALASILRRVETAADQQHAIAVDQLEVEPSVAFPILLERRQRGLGRTCALR